MTNVIIINYEHKPIIRNIIRPAVTHLFIFSQEECHKYLLIRFSICHEAAEVRIKLQPYYVDPFSVLCIHFFFFLLFPFVLTRTT